jgi:NDP-sugar pyrophosphorylase family protein
VKKRRSQIRTAGVRAVILAGGKGTRLWPLTAVFPKPLVPLGNKPVLEILLRRLKSCGITDVTICTGYLSELIKAVCNDGHRYGLHIDYVHEERPLGTAGPLAQVPNLTDPFIVMNGDLLTTMQFDRMIGFHRSQRANLTLGVFPREVRIDFGVIQIGAGGKFDGYREKPTFHFDVSMGVNVIALSAMKYVHPGKYLDMPDLVLNVHKRGGRVKCYRESCRWLDIGRMEDYAQAQEEFARNEAAFLNGRSSKNHLDHRRGRLFRPSSHPVSPDPA